MAEYLRLFDPTQQFQLKNGMINVSGRLYVYLSETDDLAEIFDENGVRLQQPAILDNNGRARGLFVDSAKTYWMDVQDQYGESLFTIRRMTPCGGGGGSVLGIKEIISTDGSISIDKYTEAGETTYDIGIAPQSDEFLEWCNCSEDNISNGNWYPTVLEGTMESQVGYGLHVNKGQLYHITTNIKVDPTGDGINYDTLSANLMFNDGEDHNVVRRNYDVDSSVNDPTLCEFSYDFIPENDGFIYLGVEGVGYFEHVSVSMQVHRVYSGINAVPDSCATKQWVQETFDYNMSGKIGYSALEYDTTGNIIGISGSSIAGGLDSATVSAIASAYAESAVSGKLDNSASSTWYPMDGNPSGFLVNADLAGYATTTYVDSSVSGKADASSLTAYQTVDGMSAYQPSGDYAFNSSLSAKADSSALTAYQTVEDMSAYQPSGDYADNSSLSAKVDQSAFDNCCSAMSGYVSSLQESATALQNDVSSISAAVSSVTGQTGNYIDWSASGTFQESGNYVSSSDMSAYVPFASMAGENNIITSISGSAIGNTSVGHEYTGIWPVVVDNTADSVSVLNKTLCVDDTMTGYESSGSAVIGVNTATVLSGLTAYQLSGDYAYNSSLSSKLDATASSMFQLSGDYQPSGDYAFNSSLTAYQPVSGMTAYAPSGDYADNSALDSKLDASASSEFYSTSNPSGFVTDLSDYQLTADMSAYQLSGDYAYNSSLADYQPTSAMTAYQPSGDYAYTSALADYQPVSAMSAYQPSGDYADASSLSAKMDASASSEYYPMTGNPSGFVTDLSDYQLTADMSGYIPTSESANYQQASAMTAYQPVGTYIYESALGWAEV